MLYSTLEKCSRVDYTPVELYVIKHDQIIFCWRFGTVQMKFHNFALVKVSLFVEFLIHILVFLPFFSASSWILFANDSLKTYVARWTRIFLIFLILTWFSVSLGKCRRGRGPYTSISKAISIWLAEHLSFYLFLALTLNSSSFVTRLFRRHLFTCG